MTDIPIPPEAVEAALAEILRQNEHLPRAVVSAAIRAALAAWTDATMYGPHSSGHGPSRPQLVLPLPQEARDE